MKPSLIFLVGSDSASALEIASRVSRSVEDKFEVTVCSDHQLIRHGTVLVALSYPFLVPEVLIDSFELAVLLHASDLPAGRGWSPANWAAENLEQLLTISLIKMSPRIDEGAVFSKTRVDFPIWMLWDEISQLLVEKQVEMLREFLNANWRAMKATKQVGSPSYLRRRTPKDSAIDPGKSIEAQWGKIRSSDFERFPNYFFLHGHRFKLKLERWPDED